MALDLDVKEMSLSERGREIMRLRRAIRKLRDSEDNEKCWILEDLLYKLLPEGFHGRGIRLSRKVFLRNCDRYWRRNQCQMQTDPKA